MGERQFEMKVETNNKKVLIVTALAGFIRSFLENDILILQKKGYEVHCAANKYHPGAEDIEIYFDKLGVYFHQVDFSSNKPISRKTIESYFQIKILRKQYAFALVHCHTPIAGAVARLAFRKNRTKGTKVIYTTHGFYFHKNSNKKSWLIFRTVEDMMSRLSDMIITINHEDYENAKKMHCKNVKYINGVGVDTERFIQCKTNKTYRENIGVKQDEVMILAIGELSNRKNHQIVIRALGKLRLKNIVFVICGNAMTSEATTEQLKHLAVENNVKLLLLGLRKDIPQVCRCADIGVISSTREGLGLAGIEMLASELPLVASATHGILDYMEDGKNGYLANPYNEDEFALGIKKLLDSNIRQAMKPACVAMARKFDKAISLQQMEAIYDEIFEEDK